MQIEVASCGVMTDCVASRATSAGIERPQEKYCQIRLMCVCYMRAIREWNVAQYDRLVYQRQDNDQVRSPEWLLRHADESRCISLTTMLILRNLRPLSSVYTIS